MEVQLILKPYSVRSKTRKEIREVYAENARNAVFLAFGDEHCRSCSNCCRDYTVVDDEGRCFFFV